MRLKKRVGYSFLTIIFFVGGVLVGGGKLLAEEVTITTYYPAPYGVYNELRSSVYYDQDNEEYYLNPDGTMPGQSQYPASNLKAPVHVKGEMGIRAAKFEDDDNANYLVDPHSLSKLRRLEVGPGKPALKVSGRTEISGELWVTGKIKMRAKGGNKQVYSFDSYDDIKLLQYLKRGEYEKLPASIVSDNTKDLNAEIALLRDAILQVNERLERLEKR